VNSSVESPENHVNPDNPWPGLSPYGTADADWFRGRGRELEDLVRRLAQNSLTVLFSRSGIGKSSLLRAALIPRLRRDAYLPIYVRLDFAEGSPPLVDQIWNELEHHLGLPQRYRGGGDGARPSLWEFFHDHEEGLLGPKLNGVVPVLIFDQFEEVFTLGEKDENSKAGVAGLIGELADLVEGRPPALLQERFNEGLGEIERFDFDERPGHILIALREDFLSHLERHRKRMPMVMENRMPLNPLNGLQAMDAVVGPAPHLLDEKVAEQIVRSVGGDTEGPLASLAIDPSLLNLICRELNHRRRARGQAKLTTELLGGSRDEILEAFYDGCFQGLDPGAAAFVEHELLNRSGHRESLSEERAIEHIGAPAVRQLVDRRLLSAEERGGVRRVELSHDLLCEVASHRRGQRLAAEEEERKQLERLAYLREVEDARRKQRRMLRFAAVLGFMGLGACLAAFHAWKKEGEAQLARQKADELARENARRSSEADFLLASEYHRTGKSTQAIAHFARSLRSDPGNIAAADSAIGLLLNPSTDIGWLPEFRPLILTEPIRRISWSPNHSPGPRLPDLLVVSGAKVSLFRLPRGNHGEPALRCEVNHRTANGYDPIVRGAAWSPDGKTIASWAADLGIRLIDAATGKVTHELTGHEDTVNSVTFSPDGKRLASTSYDHRTMLWDAATGSRLQTLEGHGLCVNDAAFSPDGHTLATASEDGTVRLWEVTTGKMTQTLSHEGAAVEEVRFSASRARPLLMTSGVAGLRWWDWRTGTPLNGLEPVPPPVRAAINPDGGQLAVSIPGETRLITVTGRRQVLSSSPSTTEAEGIAYSPEGRRIARWHGTTLRVWSSETLEAFTKPLRVPIPIQAADWSADGRHLAVASGLFVTVWDASERPPLVVTVPDGGNVAAKNPLLGAASAAGASTPPSAVLLGSGAYIGTNFGKTARLWSARTGVPAGRPILRQNDSDVAAFSPDGSIFVSSIENKVLRHDTRTGKLIGEAPGHTDEIQHIIFDAPGRRFATSSTDSTVILWDAADGAKLLVLRHPLDLQIASSRFSPDGSQLLFIGYNNTAYLANLADGSVFPDRIFAHGDRVNSAEFSACGRLIATASSDGYASIWESATGRKIQSIQHLGDTYRARFSQDGSILATLVKDDSRVTLWSVETGKQLGKALVHDGPIKAFAFSAGQRIITASSDGTARIWDIRTGEPVGGALVHADGVSGAEFSHDGRIALTTSIDKRARAWETFACGGDIRGESTPTWLPDMLDEATEVVIHGTSQETRSPPSCTTLRERLTELALPWSQPFPNHEDHYARAAAWLSLDPDRRPGAFGSDIPLESEKRVLLTSTNVVDIRRAFQLGPHHGEGQAALARFEPDRERSDFLLQFALAREPGDPETVFQAALALEKRSMHDETNSADRERARQLLEEVLKLHPGNPHCLRALGWLMARENRKEEALALFDRAIHATPDDPDLHEFHGFALSLLAEPERALEAWRKAEKLYPADHNISDLLAGIAIGHWQLGQRKEAVSAFKRLAYSDPNRDWELARTIEDLPGDWTVSEREILAAIRSAALAD